VKEVDLEEEMVEAKGHRVRAALNSRKGPMLRRSVPCSKVVERRMTA
jgi:hypothetical protein